MSDTDETQMKFRQAMSSLAAAVNVVTTNGPAGKLGITVSAVCSVTDTPPTVLVCINRNSAANEVVRANGHLAINVLSSSQSDLAKHFSGATDVPMAERFEWDLWEDSHELPVLRDARVALAGSVQDVIERGTHSVFFVELDHIAYRDEKESLVYYARSFHRVGALSSL